MSDERFRLPMQVREAGYPLMVAVLGSTAYGLATPESDMDYLGLYATTPNTLLGIRSYPDSVVTNDPDIQLHELAKFVKLVLKGNPTVTELLFAESYELDSPAARMLRSGRGLLLSTPAVRKSYGGYLMAQVNRLANRGDGSFSADTRKRVSKHARHIWRLWIQGTELLKTGSLTLRLDDPDEVRAMGESCAENPARFIELARLACAQLDDVDSVLPDKVDINLVHDLVVAVRMQAEIDHLHAWLDE